MLTLMQFFGLTHLVRFYYGATWSLAAKNLFNWKDEAAGQDFENRVKYFVHPERILRVIRDFILFTRKDDELSKVVLRPHQMRAVERALVRAQGVNIVGSRMRNSRLWARAANSWRRSGAGATRKASERVRSHWQLECWPLTESSMLSACRNVAKV